MPFAAKMSLLSSGKRLNCVSLCLWWSGKDQPSVSAAQGEREKRRTKSMLDWGELQLSVAHSSSTCLNFTLKKANQDQNKEKENLEIFLPLDSVIKLQLQYSRTWITFSVYCAISQVMAWSKALRSQGASLESLIWQRFYWQIYKPQQRLPLMTSKRKGES